MRYTYVISRVGGAILENDWSEANEQNTYREKHEQSELV